MMFLDLMMQHAPKLVAQTSMMPILQHFVHLLASETRSRSVAARSQAAMTQVDIHCLRVRVDSPFQHPETAMSQVFS